MAEINYTTVHHNSRKELGLTMVEYAIADLVYNLQNHTKSRLKGWCYASKPTMGNLIGVSRRTVFNTIDALLKKEIIEKNDKGYLKTTDKWYKTAVLRLGSAEVALVQELHGGSAIVALVDGVNSATIAPNNKIIEKKNDKDIPLPPLELNGIKPNESGGFGFSSGGRTIANSAQFPQIWQEFFDYYLSVSGEKHTKPTSGRKDKLKTRLETFTLEEIKQAVSNAFNDDFYSGNNDRGWRADIDYFLRNDEVLDRLMRLKPRKKSHIMLEE